MNDSYGIAYERRGRIDLDKPATEDNLRTVEFSVLPPTSGVPLSVARSMADQVTVIRPQDRVHVINLQTWAEKHYKNSTTGKFFKETTI